MPTRIFILPDFAKFVKKERLSDSVLVESIEKAERGLEGVDLGGGLRKMRVAREGQGSRGGYRTIVAYIAGERAFFLVGFGKNDLDNIGPLTLEELRRRAQMLQAFTEGELDGRKSAAEIREIDRA